MVIGICDDDKIWCKNAQNIIEEYSEIKDVPVEFAIFYDREMLLNYEGSPLDVLFMDIELNEDNGIKAAGLINQKWKSCQIIYLTNYLFYATDVYDTLHSYFVLKKQFKERISDVFSKIFHGLEQNEKKLVFHLIGGDVISLAPEEILYFERNARITKIVSVWGEFRIWKKINDIVSELPNLDFVKCHSSYIVYLPAIVKLDRNNIFMKNGVKISISRSCSINVKRAFFNWAQTQTV